MINKVILDFSRFGLQDYSMTFQKYCVPCKIQKYCTNGKDNPFTVVINCNDLTQLQEKAKYEQLKKLQKKESVGVTHEQLLKKVKIIMQKIFSQLWQDKIKNNEEMRCLDSSKVDTIFVSQQGQTWWADFAATMKEINKECGKNHLNSDYFQY